MLGSMSRPATIQFIGPAVVFVTVLSAEGAAAALSHAPASRLLWYLNLELFGIFQQSHYFFVTYVDIAYFQLLFIALPLMVLASYGLHRERSLALALASNLSCVYASFLVYTWCLACLPRTASLVAMHVSAGPDLFLCAVLLGSSLLSFVVAHMTYIRSLYNKNADGR